ncbi:hypothetical protein GCM10028798_07490 [Humibacter antri]
MGTQIWRAGTNGDWFEAANWTSGTVPTIGDTALITSGTPIIPAGSPVLEGVTIKLAGSQTTATTIALETFDAAFVGTNGHPQARAELIVTGGEPGTSPLNAMLVAKGSTSFDGQILIGAMGGGLTVEAQSNGTDPGNFTLLNTDSKAVLVVSQGSSLTLGGQAFTNNALIQVAGALDIAAGVAVEGSGAIVLENGGRLSIEGIVGVDQAVDFVDGTGTATLTGEFLGTFGFTEAGGNRIDLPMAQVQSTNFVAATRSEPARLELFAGPNQTGTLVTLFVQLVHSGNWSPLPFGEQVLAVSDFLIDGENGDVRIAYAPQGVTVLEQSMPTALAASAGTKVPFSTILTQSFGTAAPGFYSMTLVPSQPFTNTSTDCGYWEEPDTTPVWYVAGTPINGATVVQNVDDVELLVGNQINNPAQFQARVTPPTAPGPETVVVEYSVWTVDPSIVQVAQIAGCGGSPTSKAVIAAAEAFNAKYPRVLNTNLCNWIGDNVAAGAGAPMPLPDALIDASLNVEGGFWRVPYTGAGPAPVSDWSTLVQPGDIVRMGWLKPEHGIASGHTTTILGVVTNAQRQIRVYDNIDRVDGAEYIGIHDASYWVATNPADITIYRLDPNQQYLILGSGLGGVIQGSVYNDLIRPGGGPAVITAGGGDNVIQGSAAELDGITVTDFRAGDALDFTDLNPDQSSVAYSDGILRVTSDGSQVAAVILPVPEPGSEFTLAADGTGGSLVGISTT